MARANKYASLNFNDIYDKKNNSKTTLNNTNNPTASSSLNKTKITNSRIHGNMLVLTRPTPKPISQAQAQPKTQTQPPPPSQQRPNTPPSDPTRLDSNSKSDSISLRPLGSTGGGSGGLPRDLSFVTAKPDKFVPPHLRPGYICKEEKPVEVVKNRDFSTGFRKFGEEGSRPKSGGGGSGGGVGYDRMRRGTAGPDFVFRPGSSAGYNRPNSSG